MIDRITNGRRRHVLLVPDSPLWVTAVIARAIARHNADLDCTICSDETFQELLQSGAAEIANRVDVVHFLTPQVADKYLRGLYERLPCVSTIHHVMDEGTIAAAWPADAVMTASRQQESEIVARGVPAAAVVRVPYGVDTRLFRPGSASERRRVRARLGIAQGSFVVGFVGKKSSDDRGRKGMETLVDAALELVERVAGATFVLAGTGWTEIAASIRARGAQCVEVPFIHSEQEFAEVYRAFDIYWVTSRVEGGPVPLLEAMASGVVALSTPVGLAPEVIQHDDNGFLIGHGDVRGFVDTTAQLARQPQAREALGNRARQAITERMQWETTAPRAMKLYERALKNFELRAGRDNRRRQLAGRRMTGSWRRWIAARDELRVMELLSRSGNGRSMQRAAIRAICQTPFNPRTWIVGSQYLPGSIAFRSVGRLLRKFGFSAGVPVRKTA
jgi:glycosyltransferase involved in cell wall biosynthesis